MYKNKKLAILQSVGVLLLIPVILFAAVGCSDTPSREIPVGRLHLALNDDERTAWSGDGPRPLAATVWYPASPEAQELDWSTGVFRFGYNALNAAFLDSEPRPLIVLSHGTGGSAAQLSWLAEHLVTEGFVVAGVNHHGNTAVEEQQWPAGFVQPWERSRDLSVLIDKILEHSEIGPRIDQRRIGAAGFSLGGYSVLGLAGVQLPSFESWEQRCSDREDSAACQLPPEANFTFDDLDSLKSSDSAFRSGLERAKDSYKDSRVTAVYVIAPALLGILNKEDVSTGDQAVRVVLSENDGQISALKSKEFVRFSLPQASLRIVPEATHYVFLAPCTFKGQFMMASLCKDPRGVNRIHVHDEIGQDAAEFFDSALH